MKKTASLSICFLLTFLNILPTPLSFAGKPIMDNRIGSSAPAAERPAQPTRPPSGTSRPIIGGPANSTMTPTAPPLGQQTFLQQMPANGATHSRTTGRSEITSFNPLSQPQNPRPNQGPRPRGIPPVGPNPQDPPMAERDVEKCSYSMVTNILDCAPSSIPDKLKNQNLESFYGSTWPVARKLIEYLQSHGKTLVALGTNRQGGSSLYDVYVRSSSRLGSNQPQRQPLGGVNFPQHVQPRGQPRRRAGDSQRTQTATFECHQYSSEPFSCKRSPSPGRPNGALLDFDMDASDIAQLRGEFQSALGDSASFDNGDFSCEQRVLRIRGTHLSCEVHYSSSGGPASVS